MGKIRRRSLSNESVVLSCDVRSSLVLQLPTPFAVLRCVANSVSPEPSTVR